MNPSMQRCQCRAVLRLIVLLFYRDFTQFATTFQLFHGDSSFIHGTWVNKLVLGQEMCIARGHSAMTALVDPGRPGSYENGKYNKPFTRTILIRRDNLIRQCKGQSETTCMWQSSALNMSERCLGPISKSVCYPSVFILS